jgi:hypothetical protein
MHAGYPPMTMEHLFLVKNEATGAEFNLTRSISSFWRSFGLKLVMDEETLDTININNNTDEERLSQVWTMWFYYNAGRKKYPLSWEGLRKLLADSRQKVIAKDYFEFLSKIYCCES